MTQDQLDQCVANATGESLGDIRRMGFSLADPAESNFDPEPDDRMRQIVDWDQCDLERNVALVDQPPFRRQRAA
ncbi:hypothetical protein [Lignipirellula cremea]|uniref:Uncharacterized protein n=1 Tax=Lignipirellula cremea TaxID=2528010 RepID=A0A518DWM5_9BACT|nr:hypothetical protein [Lignipirellula cremea]QDU96237.1 hypothetical protein Pla8534_40560 [Lignipirellula cremea]